jgi:hypothetical protein
MKDYLGQIAARVGPTPVTVRPVLPSFFEPVRADAPIAADLAGQETSRDLPPAGQAGIGIDAAHKRAAIVQSLWTTASGSKVPSPAESATNLAAEDIFQMPATESARITPASSGGLPHKNFEVKPQLAQAAESDQSFPSDEAENFLQTPDRNNELIPIAPRKMQNPNVQDPNPAVPARQFLLPATAYVPHPPVAGNERTLANTPPSSSADSAPAPVIHITIGRLEVRAITAPAAAPAQRPERAIPKLSLDNYLRSRNGGGA